MPIRSSQVEGSGLVLVLAMGAIGLAFIGIGLSSGAITKSCNPITPLKGCQLWASGNITMILPVGTITKVSPDITFPLAPRQPTVSIVLQNDTDNQLDSQIGPIDLYYGASRSMLVGTGPTELWGTAESETTCEFAYLCVASVISGTCNLLAIITNAGLGGSHMRLQFSPDGLSWYDFLDDTINGPYGGDIVISGTGIQASQAYGTVPVNMTALNNFIQWNAVIVFRVILFGGGGTVSLGHIWFTCSNPNTQQFFYNYYLINWSSFRIYYNSEVPVPWLTGNQKFEVRFTWQVWIK